MRTLEEKTDSGGHGFNGNSEGIHGLAVGKLATGLRLEQRPCSAVQSSTASAVAASQEKPEICVIRGVEVLLFVIWDCVSPCSPS